MKEIHTTIRKLQEWIKDKPDVLAVGYVGSWARGEARPDSDLDLIVVTKEPGKYLIDPAWLSFFGKIREAKKEDWGLVQSWRTCYEDGDEIEFGITTDKWTEIPPDEGTKRTVKDGMKIVYDPQKLLGNLQRAVQAEK